MGKNKATINVQSKTAGTPIPVASVDYSKVTDRRGRMYKYTPLAKSPHSRHVIIYPPASKVGDEEIPIQNDRGGPINGASAELMLASVYMDMKTSGDKNIDPAVLYHLERALANLVKSGALASVP